MNAASAQTVAEVMSTDLLTLKLTDTLRLADDMLNLAQVRHFPVLDGDTIAGLVDQDDLLHATSTRPAARSSWQRHRQGHHETGNHHQPGFGDPRRRRDHG